MRVLAHLLSFAGVLLLAQDYRAQRERLVRESMEGKGIRSPAVLKAMRETPRHEFMPLEVRRHAYADSAIPIGHEQTISQPSLVAMMTELLDVRREHRILEIGTGSGYQAAVLAALAKEVYTVEIVPELARSSSAAFQRLGYTNIISKLGNGYLGWREHAPFDRIILTAAPPDIPQALVAQLKPGGKLVAPIGLTTVEQQLVLVEKSNDGKVSQKSVFPVRFVPMVQEPAAR